MYAGIGIAPMISPATVAEFMVYMLMIWVLGYWVDLERLLISRLMNQIMSNCFGLLSAEVSMDSILDPWKMNE